MFTYIDFPLRKYANYLIAYDMSQRIILRINFVVKKNMGNASNKGPNYLSYKEKKQVHFKCDKFKFKLQDAFWNVFSFFNVQILFKLMPAMLVVFAVLFSNQKRKSGN